MAFSSFKLFLLCRILTKALLFAFYIYIYDNYRIYTLPWDSIWTWIIAAVGYDLGYYWVHRAAHGNNDFVESISNYLYFFPMVAELGIFYFC